MNEDLGPISVEEAKLRLLDWSQEADESLRQEIRRAIDSAKAKTRKVLPWAAGAAMLLGLLSGRGRRAKSDGAGGAQGPVRAGIGAIRSAIRVGIFVLPLIKPFFTARKSRD